MPKFRLLLSAVAFCTLTADAADVNRQDCRRLVSILTQAKEKCEICPDSFHTYVRVLRKELETQTDSTSKAVYQATLAHLLIQNQWRAQTDRRDTASPEDSTLEWSREEYCAYAAQLYRRSLAQAERLYSSPTKAWLPLTERGKDEKVFGGGMLHVVWNAMKQDLTQYERRQYSLPPYSTLTSLYERHGLEEAAMLTTLDSINTMEWDKRETEYRKLIDKYDHLDGVDAAYTRLAALLDKEKQVALLREGLEKHKKSKAIRNALNNALTPSLSYRMPRLCYPEREYRIPFSVSNMKDMTLTVYKMDDGFKPDDDKPLYTQVKRAGKEIQRHRHVFATHPAEEDWNDTLTWKAPENGTYAMTVEGKAGLKVDKGSTPETHLFYVSRFGRIIHAMPDGKTQVIVVDAMSGKPQQDVNVRIERRRTDGEYTTLKEDVTDRRGVVLYDNDNRGHVRIKLYKGDDTAWMDAENGADIYHSYYTSQTDDKTSHLEIFTDRSIYRPGQTVHIAALAYSRQGDEWKVRQGETLNLSVLDTERKKMHESTPRTDEFGMVSDSLTLPDNTRPGTYTIRMDGRTTSVRVEEYRRPTFTVEMDEAPAVSFPIDTLTLTGKARTYSGVPVAGARVTGNASFSSNLWRYNSVSRTVGLDTLTTDTDGSFAVKIPLEGGTDFIKTVGTRVRVLLDVLDKTGETQQGEAYVALCSRPFVLTGEIPQLQDRQTPRPWSFTLLSSTGSPIDGEVTCRITQDDKDMATFTAQAGTQTTPECLTAIPSGDYEVKAEYTDNKDTARWSFSFSLISIDDKRLYGSQPLRIYAPTDTFSAERPASFLLGTTLKEAWVYCTITSDKATVADTLMCLSDTAFVWTIPYGEECGKGMGVKACLMYEGKMTQATRKFYKAAPDDKLRMKWETFRNLSSPGKHEQWTMSLYMPDGTPAHANVLLSMYDASLDALWKHGISLHKYYSRYAPFANYLENGMFSLDRWRWYLSFTPKMYSQKDKVFSTFNPYYFNEQTYGTNVRSLRKGRLMAKGARETYAASALMLADTDALNGKIAGLEMSTDAMPEEETTEGEGMSDVTLRGAKDISFTSLAFFKPTIHTDSDGRASISFDMPESLTSWHLTGFAHTKELFTAGIDETITARKELMATLYMPRFLRQGDTSSFTASIHNVSDKAQEGTATCTLTDAATDKVLMRKNVRFSLEAGKDTVYTLLYSAPADANDIVVRWKAKGSDFSDGEQRTLPVLSDKEVVTDTKVFTLKKAGTTNIGLSSLFGNNHPSATDRTVTVEYAARPVWFALKSLPSLFTPVHKDALSLCAAYYATTLARHITSKADSAAWLADSLHYGTALQLDRRMSMLTALAAMQQTDGSFAWYPGMRGNTYVTTEIAMLLARLRHIGTATDAATMAADAMLDKAIGFLGTRKSGYVDTLPYLYILYRSGMDTGKKKDIKEKVETVAKEADNYTSVEYKAMAAIVLKAYGKDKEAAKLMVDIERRVRQADGFYIAYPSGSRTSIDRKIVAHVQVMEAFSETMPEKEDVATGLTEWLLMQKRTQQWDNPVNTANAVYALMQNDWTQSGDMTRDVLKLKDVDGTHKMKSSSSAAGYMRDSVEVKAPRTLTVEKRTTSLSWGSVYATYSMPIDSVTAHWQGFKIRRDMPEQPCKVGDRIHIRYTVTADNDYDFVYLQLPRPAAAEPAVQLSGYRWQGGLGYYTVTGDDGSEYFVDSMPKGTYVIEEDWTVAHNGDFSLGNAVIKCLYADEFQSHTASNRMKVRADAKNDK